MDSKTIKISELDSGLDVAKLERLRKILAAVQNFPQEKFEPSRPFSRGPEPSKPKKASNKARLADSDDEIYFSD